MGKGLAKQVLTLVDWVNAVTALAFNYTDSDEPINQNCDESDDAPIWNSQRPLPEAGGVVAGKPKASRYSGITSSGCQNLGVTNPLFGRN